MSHDDERLSAWAWSLSALILMAAFGLRLWLGEGLPLWLDETWTGMIATQPNWASFWHEAWLDCNPPLYYAVIALWTAAFGASDIMLRLPSLLFVFLAVLLPLCIRVPGLGRRAALCFALLLALWQPGFEISLDARGYGLLLLLGVVQLLAFIRLMAGPTPQRAWLWAVASSLAGLTHYHALLVSGLQGLALLYVYRASLLPLWPAGLAFVPAFGWLAIHAPRLADYARPDVAWYEPMTWQLAGNFMGYVLGEASWRHVFLLALLGAASLGFGWRSARPQPALNNQNALYWAVFVSLAGFAIELTLGALRPMLTDRYLVPLVPGLLLGLVLITARAPRKDFALTGLVLVFALTLDPGRMRAKLVDKTLYGFASASAFLSASPAKSLVFSWDHPAAKILQPASLAKLGGFFIHRAGKDIPVKAVILPSGRDANGLLERMSPADAGVIWIYNRARTSAARHRPPIPHLWHNRMCELKKGKWIGTLACEPQHD